MKAEINWKRILTSTAVVLVYFGLLLYLSRYIE